ncbi:MAG: hypothetical protein R3C26_15770 [Calditrichia bacterium]
MWWEASHQPDFDKLLNETIGISNEVLFVPSWRFIRRKAGLSGLTKTHAVAPRNNGMRLSFLLNTARKITEGIQLLGSLLKSHLNS